MLECGHVGGLDGGIRGFEVGDGFGAGAGAGAGTGMVLVVERRGLALVVPIREVIVDNGADDRCESSDEHASCFIILHSPFLYPTNLDGDINLD